MAKLRAYELAEKLEIYVIHYLAIEAWLWEKPTDEETCKICEFFGASPQELGLPELTSDQAPVKVPEQKILLEKGTIAQLKLW